MIVPGRSKNCCIVVSRPRAFVFPVGTRMAPKEPRVISVEIPAITGALTPSWLPCRSQAEDCQAMMLSSLRHTGVAGTPPVVAMHLRR
jgi:hypothetical protein